MDTPRWRWDDIGRIAVPQVDDTHRTQLPSMVSRQERVGGVVSVTVVTWQPLVDDEDSCWQLAGLPDPVAVGRAGTWIAAASQACSRARAYYGATEHGGRWLEIIRNALAQPPGTVYDGPAPIHPHVQAAAPLVPTPRQPVLDVADRAAIALGSLAPAVGEIRLAVEQAAARVAPWAPPTDDALTRTAQTLRSLEGCLRDDGDALTALTLAARARGTCETWDLRPRAEGIHAIVRAIGLLTGLLGGPTQEEPATLAALHDTVARLQDLADA